MGKVMSDMYESKRYPTEWLVQCCVRSLVLPMRNGLHNRALLVRKGQTIPQHRRPDTGAFRDRASQASTAWLTA